MATDQHHSAELLQSATRGFDFLFSNDIAAAKQHFSDKNDPFHLLGLGACAFMEAALGMESGHMAEATRCLNLSEAGARQQQKVPKTRTNQRFPSGLEWEILNADAVVLLGLTQALSESYMGYLQCMYSLNSAHSKFTKLFKTVFPNGIDSSTTPTPSRKSSNPSIHSTASAPSTTTPSSTRALPPTQQKSLFSRWTSSASASPASSTLSVPATISDNAPPDELLDGPVEELILAGTAFGFGLFNLVFSLLPKKVQGLVGFLGFKHDRKLGLQALALSATKQDVHSVFAGLVLMTYHAVVLLLSGYQADEAHIIKQYKSILDSIEARYPDGALWVLNRAKILRMSYDAESAIHVLRNGLRPGRPHTFAQADTLLAFELAWTLLGQMRYQDAADVFLKLTELNSWSHGTYYFLAAGCYVSLGNTAQAQKLFNIIPELIDKKKIGGKDLPTEVFIKKKLEFYKEKQCRRGGREEEYAQAIKISGAEELGIFWNMHARIERRLALAHIREWSALTPSVSSPSNPPPSTPRTPRTPRTPGFGFLTPSKARHGGLETVPITDVEGSNPKHLPDLDTPDEFALRSLLLGISHRTSGDFAASRTCLKDAFAHQPHIRVSTWIPGMAMFELAVLDLKVVEAKEQEREKGGVHQVVELLTEWDRMLKSAAAKLDAASALAGGSVDLSSRLESRIEMLRDEIAAKRGILEI